MAISFTCPQCGTTTAVEESFAGQSGPCASCGATVTIPGAAALARPPSGGSSATKVVVIVLATCVIGLMVCGGGLAALLYPAIQAARTAAARVQSMNNLKQIGIAFHNYHLVHGKLPPAYIPDEDGQPMHSWRVLLLPYLEQQAIHDRYDFDEPWDSPTNLAVTDVYLPIYYSSNDRSNGCSYFVIDVPGGVFDGSKATKFDQVADGLSNTIMVVEVTGSNQHWAEPTDLGPQALSIPINGAKNGTAISSNRDATALVLMGDGSVISLDESTTQAALQAMATMADGQAIPVVNY